MGGLQLRGVRKTYRGGIAATADVDLAVEPGELFAVVGPSGAGKSTLLRLVAGLERLDAGSIHLDGRRIDGLPPRDRGLAMVFQDAVVYPHLDVAGNIAFGLRARRVGRAEVRARVAATAELLGLGDLLRRGPSTLSGGERRRVALARALAIRPGLLLLDEPFAGLDAPLRASIRAEIADLHRRAGATMVLVTHDQGEALALADRIAVVDAGRVVQVGTPREVYDRPATRFVAGFVGQPPMALVPCTVVDDGGDASIRVAVVGATFGPWFVARRSAAGAALAGRSGGRVDLGLRPERVVVNPDPPGGILPPGWMLGLATVDRLEVAGHETAATLRLGPHPVRARLPAATPLVVGDRAALAVDLGAACWFDPAAGDRLGAAGPPGRIDPPGPPP